MRCAASVVVGGASDLLKGGSMDQRKLRDLEVSAIGLGCMGMSAFYGSTDEAESVETIRRALDNARGVKKDAAELMGISQRALSYYLAKYRID